MESESETGRGILTCTWWMILLFCYFVSRMPNFSAATNGIIRGGLAHRPRRYSQQLSQRNDHDGECRTLPSHQKRGEFELLNIEGVSL